MVGAKRSKKSKSKRLTLKQKYKQIKKVKEHHRKQRRELKKSGRKPKDLKTVGPEIPSQWPFKEELLKEMAWKRQQVLLADKAKREERKRNREERNAAAMDDEQEDLQQLAALQASAAHKATDFEARKKAKLTSEGTKAGDADNSRRAFYKEFRRVVEASDVVIQVLDARDPAGCRCPDVERYVRSLDASKRIILLLNKMDLVPREVGEAWLKHYRQELPAVAFKASTQQQQEGLGKAKAVKGGKGKKGSSAAAAACSEQSYAAAGSACLGADTLLQLLKNYARNAMGGKGSITVGVVGLPNVGKSSLINSLKRARVAQVGSTPGVTKGVQEIHLDKHIRLLDSPGIVFTSGEGAAAAALRNAIKVERLADPLTPVGEILKRVPSKQLMAVYKIGAFAGVDQFLQLIAAARGKLKKGGIVDVEAAARIVLQDWNEGRIPYYTLPPKAKNTQYNTAEVVTSWAAEFDADTVFADEAKAVIQHLPSLEDDGAAFFEAQSAGAVAMQLEEAEEQQQQQAADGEDAMDDEDGAPSTSGKAAAAAAAAGKAGQNVELYNAVGQHNPKKAKAEQKKAKRLKADFASFAAAADGDESDFDFDEANEADGIKEAASGEEGMSGSDVGSGSGSEDGEQEGGSSEEYGAGSDSEDADRKYEDAMES
uniref:CP-type G domain-containing protein n=1 Tax=Tetradesmus obliquus TaxID=3088 RepID=A0A383VGF9_TETOB|eukprot:jgi/Sobl393_1/16203/SZX64010.1